jgi:hypothetical protein
LGLGEVDPAVPDGAAAPSSSPLAEATDSSLDEVLVGGEQETVTFNGLTPGLAGLFQLNTGIVASTPSGADFADISTPDAITSEATLAVGPAGSSVTGMARSQALKLKGGAAKVRQGRTGRATAGPGRD